MEVEENNKIAKFMGFEFQDDPNERFFGSWFTNPNWVWARRIELLHFDTDWNWLMKVVEKIESLSLDDEIDGLDETISLGEICSIVENMNYPNVIIGAVNYCIIQDSCGELFEFIGEGESKLLSVYNAVIQFIDWYNNYNLNDNQKLGQSTII